MGGQIDYDKLDLLVAHHEVDDVESLVASLLQIQAYRQATVG